jgi:hypothetical protein
MTSFTSAGHTSAIRSNDLEKIGEKMIPFELMGLDVDSSIYAKIYGGV